MLNDISAELIEQDSYCMNVLASQLEDGYTCLRGPRPSGALLHLKYPEEVQTSEDEFIEVRDIMGGVYPPFGSPSCKEEGKCMIVDGHCVRNVHAEVNAIVNAAALGASTKGSTIYSWNKPCYNCTITAIQAGVTRIVYRHAVYDEERTKQAIIAAGIYCEQYVGFIGE